MIEKNFDDLIYRKCPPVPVQYIASRSSGDRQEQSIVAGLNQ